MASVLDTARSQIAGTITTPRSADAAAQRPPVPGPRAARAGRLAAERRRRAALRRDVGGARCGPVGRRASATSPTTSSWTGCRPTTTPPALAGLPLGVDAVDQFQVVTSGGQAELGRALGGFVNVVTRSGTNAVRGDGLRLLPRRPVQRPQRPVGHEAADEPAAGRRQRRRPARRDRTFYFANVEQRRLDQTGLTTISRRQPRRPCRRGSRRWAIRARAVATGVYPNPVDTTHLLGESSTIRSAGHDQVSVRYSLSDVSSRNSRGAGALERARAPRPGWTIAISAVAVRQHADALTAHRQRDARAGRPRTPGRAADGCSRAGGRPSPASATFGTFIHQSDRPRQHDAAGGGQRVAAGRRARVAGRRRRPLQRQHRHVPARVARQTYAFSSLANFLSGTYNNAGFTQTFGATVVSQTNPNVGLFAQDEWRVRPDLTLNLGVRYDLQFLETIRTRRQQRGAACGRRVDAVRVASHRRAGQQRSVLRPRAAACGGQRAAVGGQHDRPGQPAAGRCEPGAGAGRRAGVPGDSRRARCRP